MTEIPAHIIPIPGFSEPVASLSHLVGAGVAALAGVWLLRRSPRSKVAILALSIYLAGVLFMFAMSGVYHLLEPGRTPRAVLQRLDHAAIWVQIAGTFTPVHALRCRGIWRWGFLALIWALATSGITLRTIFFHGLPEAWISLLYLGMGWLGIFSIFHMWRRDGPRFVAPLIVGGLLYTAGAVIELVRWPAPVPGVVGSHELFHLFVIGGVYVHWRFISRAIAGGSMIRVVDSGR